MKPSFLKSINNITDFIKEQKDKGEIDSTLITKKIRTELSTLNKEELLELSMTLVFKDIAETFFTKESIDKMIDKWGN